MNSLMTHETLLIEVILTNKPFLKTSPKILGKIPKPTQVSLQKCQSCQSLFHIVGLAEGILELLRM